MDYQSSQAKLAIQELLTEIGLSDFEVSIREATNGKLEVHFHCSTNIINNELVPNPFKDAVSIRQYESLKTENKGLAKYQDYYYLAKEMEVAKAKAGAK